jgi:hypothetical protein
VTLQGGSITNTSATTGTVAGTFTFGDAISGYGRISGPISINGGLTATGGTLNVDGRNATVYGNTGGWTVASTGVMNLFGQVNLFGQGGLGGPVLSDAGILGFEILGASNFGQLTYSNANALTASGKVEFDFLNGSLRSRVRRSSFM